MIAFSRILAASEVLVVANTSTAQPFTGHVLVDTNLTPPGAQLTVTYSDQAGARTPDVTVERPAGSVSVNDGSGDSVGPDLHRRDLAAPYGGPDPRAGLIV